MKYNRETIRTTRAVTHFIISLMFNMTHFTSKTLFKILFPAFLFQMHVLDLIREINLSVNESCIDTTTNNKYGPHTAGRLNLLRRIRSNTDTLSSERIYR